MGPAREVSESAQNQIWFDDATLMQPAPVDLIDSSPFFNGWLSGRVC